MTISPRSNESDADERRHRPPTGGRRCGRAYGGVRERHTTSGYGRIGVF